MTAWLVALNMPQPAQYIISGNEGNGCAAGDKFVPTFPGTCPWATSVGERRRNSPHFHDHKGSTHEIGPEVAAFFSGGGFSNYFEAQSYQTDAVQAYLAVSPLF
jgi:tripeptidyl-peptidase-1